MTKKESIAFYNKHSKRVFNICLRIVSDISLAEEIMQDTILKFLMNPVGGLSEPQIYTWLARTAARASIDELRRRKGVFFEEIQSQDFPIEEKEILINDEQMLLKLKQAVEKLNEPYRSLMDLIYLEGFDYEEVEQITGMKQTTLRSQASRGRQLLKDLLRNE